MKKYIMMIVVLVGISLVSGLLLGVLKAATKQKIAEQILNRKKLPAVKSLFTEADNDLVKDHLELDLGEEQPYFVFVGKKGGKPYAVALEQFGKGYGGDVGVMVAFNLETGDLIGMQVTTHSETPGVGSRVTTDSAFIGQFKGMKADPEAKLKKDGGKIDAITGASFSSRGVAAALAKAVTFYQQHQQEIKGKIGL